jgi:hypothetical protein
LVLGCGAIFIGLVMSSRTHYPERAFWMRIEAIGLVAIAYFCYLYTVCIVFAAFETAWSAGMLILAFGGVSHVREASLQIELEQYRRSLGLEEKA